MEKWWEEELTEISGPLVKPPPLLMVLGRESRLFRKLYSRLTKKYWWRVMQALVDANTTWRT